MPSRYYGLTRKISELKRISRNCGCGNDYHTSAILLNHYTSLGISQKATQNEIKAAYYKLSMMYHPDKNQGCEEAATKFREISKAYEVLSNYRLRRLYDKGIIHTAGAEYASYAKERRADVEDDPQTKFYKSRFTRSEIKDSQGRTPIYNFDEWSRAHYGKTFERRQTAKAKWERQEAMDRTHRGNLESASAIYGLFFTCIAVYLVFLVESSYDQPKPRSTEGQKEN